MNTIVKTRMQAQAGLIAPPGCHIATHSVSIVPSFQEEPDCALARCPQGSDCAGESELVRLFDCEEGCGFRGCGACMEVHASEPHSSDSDVMLAMVRNIGGAW